MTNKEAAKFIWDVLDGVKSFNEEGGKGTEALDLAIKALENERPHGMWYRTGQSFIHPYKFRNFGCSVCHHELDEHIKEEPNFCPNCGADMRGNLE